MASDEPSESSSTSPPDSGLRVLRVATLNLGGLHTKRGLQSDKLDLLLEACLQQDIALLLCQETWEPEELPSEEQVLTHQLDLPDAWRVLSIPSAAMPRRRGVLILANDAMLSEFGWHLTHIAHCRDDKTFEYLLAEVGPWRVASVYLPPPAGVPTPYKTVKDLADHMLRACPDLLESCRPLILGGDFNHRLHVSHLVRAMEHQLEATPLVLPDSGLITRPAQGRTRTGALLDNIYHTSFSPGLEPTLVGVMPCQVARPAGNRVSFGSDHHMVVAAVPVPLDELTPPASPTPSARHRRRRPGPRQQPRGPRRVRWLQLRRLQEESRSRDSAVADAAREHLDIIRNRLAAIDTEDLDTFNDACLHIMAEELGTHRHRPGVRHPYMCRPGVRDALRTLRRSHKRYLSIRTVTRGMEAHATAPDPIPAAQERLEEARKAWLTAQREWEQTRQQAMADTQEDLFTQVASSAALPNEFFRRFRKARGAKRENGRDLPYLRQDKMLAFWREVFRRRAPDPEGDVSTWEPLATEAEILASLGLTPEMVVYAIHKMSRRCVGPDGADFLLFQVFADTLAPTLVRCFNRVAAHGLPAHSPLRVSETLLFYKLESRVYASDPSKYRPISLLPMAMRVFHKLLDLRFRGQDPESLPKPKPGEEPAAPLFPQRTWSFDRVQAGFEPRRSCHEQAFILHQLQANCRDHNRVNTRHQKGGRNIPLPKPARYAAFLDLAKAYDSMEYCVILKHLQTLPGFPLPWVEILRRLLPGNFTMLQGHRIPFERGLPQGGALCPFLCQAFMDSLATRLRRYVAARGGPGSEEEPIPSVWPPEGGNRRWWRPPETLDEFSLMSLLYADDVTLLGADLFCLQDLLDEVYAWAQDSYVDFSDKSRAQCLSGEPKSEFPGPSDHQLFIGPSREEGLPLPWSAEPFRYLGVPTMPHRYGPQGANRQRGQRRVPYNAAKLARARYGLRQVCSLRPGQLYVVMPALRFGVMQVINASALYPTAIADVDYDSLDKDTLATVRSCLGLSMAVPSPYLRWVTRLPYSHLLGHFRGIMEGSKIWHHSWFGKELLQPLYKDEHAARPGANNSLPRPPRPGHHVLFKQGPVARWADLAARYLPPHPPPAGQPVPSEPGLAWLHGQEFHWSERRALKARLDQALHAHFYAEVRHRTETARDLHPSMRAALLEHLDVCSSPEVPMWHFEPYDLPRAAILFQAPTLAYTWRWTLEHGRSPCAWCAAADGEWGSHLLTCPHAPPRLVAIRDATLQAIMQDCTHPLHAPAGMQPQPPAPATLLKSLYYLQWVGCHPTDRQRKQHRADTGTQPGCQPLRMALWYMRECINAYSASTPIIPETGQRRVRPLPVYGRSPFP